MKYFVIHDGETIKHAQPIGHDFTAADVLVLDEMPTFLHQDGKIATLKYNEADGVHYEYTDAPANDEITGEELTEMLGEVM